MRWVPDYAVPHFYLWQPSLPTTSGGKVDRSALPEPAWSAFAQDGVSAGPRTPTEQALAQLLVGVLTPAVPGAPATGAPERINTLATFSESGLDSLSVLDLLFRALDRFGADAEVEEGELSRLTIQEYAQVIDERRRKAAYSRALTVRREGGEP